MPDIEGSSLRPTEAGPAELDRFTKATEGWSLRPAEAGPAELERLPEQWREITRATDPQTRRAAALALWPREFLGLAPEFARLFADRLTDVRSYFADTEPVLVYQTDQEVWIGRDPRTFTSPPPFWDRLPQPAQHFQQAVHAAFTFPNQESYGLMHPAHLRTIAEMAGRPTGIPGWDEAAAARPDGRIASNRLLPITRDAGNLWLCLSPDLPQGQVAMVYEGDVDPDDFTHEFDDLLVRAFEGT